MDALDKAIAEVRAVREHDEKLLADMESEKDAITSGMDGFIRSGVINDTLTIRNMMDISAAFAAGWVGGREYVEKRKG